MRGHKSAARAAPEAPDGGYGWVVVLAYSLHTTAVLQIMALFGLIFKDMFAELNMPTTDIALVLNINMSVSLLMGLFTNPLMLKMGFRLMGVAGAVLAVIGMLLTAFSSSVATLVFNYGVVMAFGMGLSSPAFTVALNTYFRARRGAATGLAFGITGVSSILVPQLVPVLLREYGARGTCVVFAGLALHGVLAAVLLQPVAWHRPAQPPVLAAVLETPSVHEHEEDPMMDKEFVLTALPVLKAQDADVEYGAGLRARQRTMSTTSTYYTARCPSSNSIWASANVLDMGSSILTLNEPIPEEAAPFPPRAQAVDDGQDDEEGDGGAEVAKRGAARRCCSNLVDSVDLTLLADPSILNLMLGIAVASFAEMNFSVFVPFILTDRGLDTGRTADAMSVIAMSATVFRLLAPFVQTQLGWSSKNMYISALVLTVGVRTALVLVKSETGVMVVALVLGASKGLRTVFYNLVIPDSVPVERLAAAIGLQALLNGIVFLVSGPLVGYIRDETGSYNMVIWVFNVVTVLCVAMWGLEHCLGSMRRPRTAKEQPCSMKPPMNYEM